MCGIAGIVGNECSTFDVRVVERLFGLLRHRGPDDVGYVAFNNGTIAKGKEVVAPITAEVLLLHRRLAILDLSSAGWQPMSSCDGRFHITYNGEVYNYVEIRAELESLGHRFRSQTDTEVVLSAYARWGTEAFRRLTGMFAFALVDTSNRQLVLVRDPFGIKPLYWTRFDGGFAFASEITPLLSLPGVSRKVDPQHAYDFVRFGITDHDGGTMFQSVRQVPPAHYFVLQTTGSRHFTSHQYWSVNPESKTGLPFDDAAEQLRELFLRSIRIHLRSDVPVGVALSGGVDSSAIAGAMRYIAPEVDIRSFSYIATDGSLSEESWIDIANKDLGAKAHKVSPTPRELLADLDELISLQEEPFGSTSIYAQYRVFRAASESGVKVMLDGQGADELLAGYRRHVTALVATLLRSGRYRAARDLLGAASRNAQLGPTWAIQSVAEQMLPPSFRAPLRRIVGRELQPAWLNDDWLREMSVTVGDFQGDGQDPFRAELVSNLTSTMLPHLLRFEDRNSMAFSIESRVPFLTTELVEFVYSLPPCYLVDASGTTKAVFRRAMRGLVSDAILDRKDKIGFEVPEQAWFKSIQGWVRSVIEQPTVDSVSILDATKVRREWQRILNGTRKYDHRVWRWINLIEWSRAFGVSYD